MKSKNTKGILILVILIIIPILIGFFSQIISTSIASSSFKDTYSGFNQPWFSPPSWLFGPVWTMLYILMGVSMYLVYKEGMQNPDVKSSFILFSIQLFLNFLWSIIFFGLSNYLLAFAEIVVLWGFIIAMVVSFRKVSRIAAYLQIPYLLWVTFAAILNLTIFLIN